jgi:hypothetical protein
MSKNRGRGRGRGGRRDRIRDRDLLTRDPIINNPVEPKEPENVGLIYGSFEQYSDQITSTPWYLNQLGARDAALAYGYDGGALEYFAYAPTLEHYQFGTMIPVFYMTQAGLQNTLLLDESIAFYAVGPTLA